MKVSVGHAHSSIEIFGLQPLMRALHRCPLTLGFTLQPSKSSHSPKVALEEMSYFITTVSLVCCCCFCL